MAELKPGDVVRVVYPDRYLAAFANKIRDRNAIVEWVGPKNNGMHKGNCCVVFQKRNGRGKEFREIMLITAFVKVRGT